MRRYYWIVRNFLSRCNYWRQGYTWREAQFKVLFVHIRKALVRLDALHREFNDLQVWRSNRISHDNQKR